MKQKMTIFLLLFLFTCKLFGQPKTFSNFSTPEVSTLFSFSEIPLNHSTGLPNINIPLYTISDGELSLPVSLSYHAGTIKPRTQPGWVGLGWELSTIGCITRTVVSLNDDADINGWYSSKESSSAYFNGSFGYGSTVDAYSDVYHYSFNGHSGKFIINEDNEILTVPYDDVMIKLIIDEDEDNWRDPDDGIITIENPVYGGSSSITSFIGFQVITSDGVVYEFKEKACAFPGGTYSYNNSSYYVNNWYLTKIIAPNGINEINLEYIKPGFPNKFHIITENDGRVMTASDQQSYDFTNNPAAPYNCNINELVYLHKITTTETNTEITFNVSERNDLQYPYIQSISDIFQYFGNNNYKGHKLDNIEIKQNGIFFRKFNFTYDPSNKLKLKSVFESLEDTSIKKPPFMFDYSPQSMSYTDRFDHWGFYNGYIDTRFANILNKIEGKKPVKEAGDHEIFPDMLVKITYPTGGHTQFNYEPNTFSKVADDANAQLEVLGSYYYTRTGTDYYNIKNGAPEDQTLQVTDSTHVYLRLRFYKDYNSPNTACYCRDLGCVFEFFLIPGAQYGVNQLIDWALGQTICNEPQCACPVYDQDTDGLVDFAEIFHFYYEETDEAFAGGARLRSVQNYDPITGASMVKTYKYELENGSSSGVISIMPFYETIGNIRYYSTVCEPDIPCANRYDFATIHYNASSPVSPISYTGGSHVAYSRIIEEQSNGARSVFTYTTFDDFPDVTDTRFKTEIIEEKSYMRGRLKSETRYLNSTNPIYSKVIAYQTSVVYDGYDISGYRGNRFRSYGTYSSSHITGVFFNFIPFVYVQKHFRIGSIAETKDGVGKTTNYSYDENYISTITEETTTSSINENIKLSKCFPFHCSSTIYSEMTARNMIATPVQQIMYRAGKVSDSQLTTYKNANGNYVPDKYYKLKNTSPLSSFTSYNGNPSSIHAGYGSAELVYNEYDDKGNVLKLTGADGIVTNIIWAYNKNYPVAKIISGADFTINTSLRETINNRSFSGTDTRSQVDADIQFLISQLTQYTTNNNYQVFLYTYKPLVGLSSETQPNGTTTYYKFDSFGRLSEVRDHDNRLLKKQSYNYANTNP
jgi:YD repeat-containing protein